MDRDETQLESLLREHFAAKLDGQLGRSTARFLREVGASRSAQPPMRLVGDDEAAPIAMQPISMPRAIPDHRRSGWSAFGWSIGLAGAAVAAGIAVVMILVPLVQRNPAPTQQVVIVPDPTERHTTVTPASDDAPRDVEHALTWNTIDQGTVYLGGEVPLRSVVRQANETVRWYDPQRNARVEMTVPRDEVMLVGYGSQ
jgi:hypothetical protein